MDHNLTLRENDPVGSSLGRSRTRTPNGSLRLLQRDPARHARAPEQLRHRVALEDGHPERRWESLVAGSRNAAQGDLRHHGGPSQDGRSQTLRPAGELRYRCLVAGTPGRQRNAVSEGTALGLLLRGCNSLPDTKLALDLAFGSAWRSWEYRSRFPQIQTDLAKGKHGTLVLTRAGRRQHVAALYWDREHGQHVIRARQPDWHPHHDPDVEFALSVIDGDVPRDGWVSLATALIERLDG